MSESVSSQKEKGRSRQKSSRDSSRVVYLIPERIEQFLSTQKKEGCTEVTIKTYRTSMNRLYAFLPENKQITQDTLSQWEAHMSAQGYSARTIYTRLAIANSFLAFLGRRNWQRRDISRKYDEPDLPELTREEYLLLLQEAKRQENIQLYLLVKVFACMGLSIQSLDKLTREAVNEGTLQIDHKLCTQALEIPPLLRRELLDYAMREGIRSGPVFVNRNGRSINRQILTVKISKLGEAAGLEPGKSNPRTLKRLYQTTLAGYQRQADAWVRKSWLALLEGEETTAGWLAGLDGENSNKNP